MELKLKIITPRSPRSPYFDVYFLECFKGPEDDQDVV